MVWNAAGLPDEEYAATFTASDLDGVELFRDERSLRKSHDAPNWTGRSGTLFRREGQAIVFGIESGVAYQLPGDNTRALRNMFTHVVFRVGYRFSSRWEAGIIVGQDAFHETPGPDVDIDRIADYGGVVGYTYGYGGAYLRWTLSASTLRPYLEIGAGLSGEAPLAQFAAGVKADIFRDVEAYLAPAALLHLRSETSTKLGIHYGMSIRF